MMNFMKVQQIFFKNTLRNFCYLITFSDGAIFCIDPFGAEEVLEVLGGKPLKAIINTHDHCDHHSGNEKLVATFKCPVLGHGEAKIPHKTHGLKEGEVVYTDGEYELKTIYTPGHTPTHICLVLEKAGKPYAVFTGDCFFNAGVGNCRSGDVADMYRTIKKYFESYADEVLIYPGHEYLKRNLEFTLNIEKSNQKAQAFLTKIKNLNMDEVFFVNDMKIERQINTFLRLHEPEIAEGLGLSGESAEKVFYTLRQKRDNW
jgi:hydroxyacylglutathione hydrolase